MTDGAAISMVPFELDHHFGRDHQLTDTDID